MTRTEQRPGGGHRGADGDLGGSAVEVSGPGRLDDSDAWVDRDGRVHRNDGPYHPYWPLKRLRRALRRWVR